MSAIRTGAVRASRSSSISNQGRTGTRRRGFDFGACVRVSRLAFNDDDLDIEVSLSDCGTPSPLKNRDPSFSEPGMTTLNFP